MISVANPVAERLLSRSATGRCHSVFESAAHFDIGGRLLLVAALDSRPARDCPFGLGLPTATWSELRHGLKPGARMTWSALRGEFVVERDRGSQVIRVDTVPTPTQTDWQLPAAIGHPSPHLLRPHLAATGLLTDYQSDEVAHRTTAAAAAMVGLAPLAGLAWMVGRGPGLTPSGDDIVLGLIAATTFRGLLTRGTIDWLDATYGDPHQTTDVSREYVRCALEGWFAPSVVSVMRALAQHDDVAEAAADLLDHGHTSGADLLLGLYLGLTTAANLSTERVLAELTP